MGDQVDQAYDDYFYYQLLERMRELEEALEDAATSLDPERKTEWYHNYKHLIRN